MSSTDPLLQLRDLRVDIGERHVLKSVSLDVKPGTVVVLMGANGSARAHSASRSPATRATRSAVAARTLPAKTCWR